MPLPLQAKMTDSSVSGCLPSTDTGQFRKKPSGKMLGTLKIEMLDELLPFIITIVLSQLFCGLCLPGGTFI